MRKYGALAAILGVLTFAPAAAAAIPSVFDGRIACEAREGVRFCQGSAPGNPSQSDPDAPLSPDTRVPTFDGVPLDVNVALPSEPAAGPDGNYPLVMIFHGWGGSKAGFGSMKRFAERGYAVFSMSDRGFGNSCGSIPSRATPNCVEGWIRLLDTRFEVHDAQYLAGLLADEGVIDPQRIGVTGGSYGGGMSMALAALRDRTMVINAAGQDELVPWVSPVKSLPMRVAVAVPEIPWTDLAYSLMPNGRTLDYAFARNSYLGDDAQRPFPIGVLKQSFVAGLFAAGEASGFYAPPGVDQDADLTQWFALVNAGEPYDENPQARSVVDEITVHHSSYYIPTGDGPAPLLISNGWTDDLFPPDEAIRFYNRTRSAFPSNDISLYFLDYGHQRGQSRPTEVAKLRAAEDAWFDHYLKGVGPKPEQGVTAISQTCGGEEYATPTAGPFTARTWDELSPGEVRFVHEAPKTISPLAGDPTQAMAFDPIVAGQDPCKDTSAADQPGTATFRMEPAKGGGFTLMGSPTIIADITSPGPHSQIAARLLDVAPNGRQRLVARALYRPEPSGRQVFQLHPNGWKFQNDHVVKLELLPADPPYGRLTNGQMPVTVANLDLRLPVRERIGNPLPNVLPSGLNPAPGINVAGPCETGLAKKGTRRNDRIKGTAGGDRLRGGKGKDRISGMGGDDCVAGNKGKDRLVGGKDRDKLRGGKGNDRINSRDNERDRVACGAGKRDKVVADRKKDKLRGCERKKRR